LLWIRFCKKQAEFNLFPSKTGVAGKDPLNRVTSYNGRGDIVYRYTGVPDYRSSAENLVVHSYLSASRIQTLETLVHTCPE
jgi:hypothetical protein